MTPTRSSRMSDEALATAEGALESTRQFASQALGMASEKVRDLRYGARDLASKSLDTVADTASAAQRRLGNYANATTRYVADQPVKSALIAASVGAILMGAYLYSRRRSNSNRY